MDPNNFTVIGRLTRDPELKSSKNGTTYAKCTIASNPTKEENETLFIDCTLFNNAANFTEWFKKGKPIWASGTLSMNRWESDGQQRERLSMVIESFKFLNFGKKDNDDNAGNYNSEMPSTQLPNNAEDGIPY